MAVLLQYKSVKNGTVESRVEKRPVIHHESVDHDLVSLLFHRVSDGSALVIGSAVLLE